MTEVIPFRGVYYNAKKVTGADVIAPPYDVITPAMQEELYKQDTHNIIKIDKGKKLEGDDDNTNRYTRARDLLSQWLADNVLIRSDKPCYYVCRMDFKECGKDKTVTGLFGLTKLVELGKGVYPHEATHSKPKRDRLSLMNHTEANTSPVYSLFKTQKGDISQVLNKAAEGEPYLNFTDPDGTVHRFWIIDADEDVATIKETLSESDIFIADGHHRYETALEYQRLKKQENGKTSELMPYDYILMYLVDINSEGLSVLPTHRVVTVDTESLHESLNQHFQIDKLADDADILAAIEGKKHAFGLYDGEARYILTCRKCSFDDVDDDLKGLDVVVLHKLIFGTLLELGGWSYEMKYETTMKMVDEDEYDAAFFLNPTAVGDVEKVAKKMLRMPPKSTYFYPKVQTGFVMNSLNTF